MEVSRSRGSRKAFSLLELIIAIAIMSIGIVMVLQAFTSSIRSTGIFCDIIKASFLTQDKIEELEFLRMQGTSDTTLESQGETGKFKWSYETESEEALNLTELKFTTSWQRSNRNESIEVDTYLR